MARQRAREEVGFTQGQADEGEGAAVAPPLPPRERALLVSHPSIRQAESMHVVSGSDEGGGWRERFRIWQEQKSEAAASGMAALESFKSQRAERERDRTAEQASAALPSGARSQSGFSDSLEDDAWKSKSGSRYDI